MAQSEDVGGAESLAEATDRQDMEKRDVPSGPVSWAGVGQSLLFRSASKCTAASSDPHPSAGHVTIRRNGRRMADNDSDVSKYACAN